MFFKKKMAVLVATAMVVMAITGCTSNEAKGSTEVASYTQGSLSEAELNERLIKTVGMQSMMDLVDQGILNDVEPVTEEMTATIESNIENIKSYYQDDFETSLKANGYDNIEELKSALMLEAQRTEYAMKYVSNTLLTDEEIVAYYDNFEPEIQASHILVAEEALAIELIDRINAGEDFAELAKEYSTDPGSGAQGGDLGSFGKGMMVPEFEEAAYALKIDEVTPVAVQSQFGFHIIKRTGGTEKTSLEEMKTDIEKSLAAEMLQADQSIALRALVQLRADNGFEIKNPVLAEQYKLLTEQLTVN